MDVYKKQIHLFSRFWMIYSRYGSAECLFYLVFLLIEVQGNELEW